MNYLQSKYETFKAGNQLLKQAYNRVGFSGLLKSIWRDLFSGMTWYQALYTLILSAMPLILELYANGKVTDWLGLIASTTGIACVIYVSMGRASNYLFGTINSVIYLILTLNATFYGEVITTIYFFIMQPIGLWMWLVNSLRAKEENAETLGEVKVKSLGVKGWIKWLTYTAAIWFLMGLAYQSIGSKRPFRDSITDGTNYTGQMLMNNLYWEQWLFWIATNIFSMYLWWGESLQMNIMYFVYGLNSLVGMIAWMRNAKRTKQTVKQ